MSSRRLKQGTLSQLTYLIEKLYVIDKELGGNAKDKKDAKKKGSEFERTNEIILKLIF